MALQLPLSSLSIFLVPLPQRLTAVGYIHQICDTRHTRCLARASTNSKVVHRRSGNYKPTMWDNDFVQSLSSDHKVKTLAIRVEELKIEVKRLLKEVVEPLLLLELIDTLQRLGIGYLFDKEIEGVLNKISLSKENIGIEKDLHATALQFRLLRQHGYKVSSDVFGDFKDQKGGFKECLCMDIKGMLSLYEASHLAFQGEIVLDEARAFTSIHLKEIKGNIDPVLIEKVKHALELPLHWRMLRSEARWYIEIYKREEGRNPTILELAKLDFNTVQAVHQQNLKRTSRWWKDLGLNKRLSFARDLLVECFLWTIGCIYEPHFGWCREVLTRVNQLITTIDDVYDVYGSLDELELFTDAVDRWDPKEIEQLPEYMKICFLALHNTTNEIAYGILKEHGWNAIPYLKKAWTDLCNTYLVEAKWYSEGYTPTLEEYMKNAWISISGPVILVNLYFTFGENITTEASNNLYNGSNIIQWSSMILRLCDDLGTSTDEIERGDVPKSIQCYMNEAGVSEDVARHHIKDLIRHTWKKLNECTVNDSSFPQTLINASVNLARMSHFMYEHGDGFGAADNEAKKRVTSLLFEPFQVDVAKGN